MKQYIGLKMVEAWPESAMPDDGSPSSPGYGVRYEDGYKSWSPAETFERAYREVGGATFGIALEALHRNPGVRIYRHGWNGKGMFVFLVREWTYTDGLHDNYPNLPFLALKTVSDEVVPWLISQTDALAEDWEIIW